MDNTVWMVVVGEVAAVVHSATIGANLMVNCWGTVLGAKVVSYRTALILGVICQSAGALAFGARKYTVFGDMLQQWTKLEPYPRLTAYSLVWIVAVPVVWQVLAVWQAVPIPAYLGTVASTVGAILVFPGASEMELGKSTPSLPFLTGLGWTLVVWTCAPTFTVCGCALLYLLLRNMIMRNEDPLHTVLWMLPVVACTVSVECVLMLVYSIRSPNGTAAFETAPQGAIIIAAAVGSAASIAMCLGVPCLSRRLWHHAAPLVKRMNQLGLDEATVQELTAEDVSRNASGWLHHTCNRLLHKDMFVHIRSSETLLRIHSTAEQFEPAAEAFFGPFQVSRPASCNLLAPCGCPLSLSACPLHLPFISLCLPLTIALGLPLRALAPALHLSLCLPFAPALCLSLLGPCACPVSLFACP
ncbi:TPA: Na+/Pi symporter [Trebouxia sp. C0005]